MSKNKRQPLTERLDSMDNTARLQDLEARTYHIDGKVAGIETQLGQQGQQLSRIEQHLLHRPAPNYAGWAGLALTMVFGMVGLIWSITNYVDIQLGHTTDDVERLSKTVGAMEAFAKQTHHEFGRLFSMSEAYGQRLNRLDNVAHDNEERVARLAADSAAAEVSRKAIGDYLKEVDRLGSRAWIERRPEE